MKKTAPSYAVWVVRQLKGDRFLCTFRDGGMWPVEFPDSVVDGDVMQVSLDVDEVLTRHQHRVTRV